MTQTTQPVHVGGTATPVIDWRAVLAGAFGAAALFGLFLAFGSALGLSMTSARPYAGLSATTIAIILALWFAAVHIASFAAGGYLAGRLRTRSDQGTSAEREFRDGAHGFLVWAVGALIAAYLVGSALTGAAKGTAEVASSAVSGMATTAAAGAASAAANSNSGTAGPDLVGYAVDLMVRPSTAAGAAATPPATVPATTTPATPAANSEIARILTVAIASGEINAADRTHLARLVASRSGLSQADAERRVDETWARMKTMRVEAETKVRDAAETARKGGVMAAFLAAAISLAGLAAAVWAAGVGGIHRDEDRHLRVLGQSRLW